MYQLTERERTALAYLATWPEGPGPDQEDHLYEIPRGVCRALEMRGLVKVREFVTGLKLHTAVAITDAGRAALAE